MRVAYVGNFASVWSTENDVATAFEQLGWSVTKLQENATAWEIIRQVALDCDLLPWTGTWDDAQPLKETVDTLRQLGLKGIPTATLHLDIFFGSDRGPRKWWLSPMFQLELALLATRARAHTATPGRFGFQRIIWR